MFKMLLPIKKATIYLVVMALVFSPLTVLGLSKKTYAANSSQSGIQATSAEAETQTAADNTELVQTDTGENSPMLRTHIGSVAVQNPTELPEIDQLDIPELKSARIVAQNTLMAKRQEMDEEWLKAVQSENSAAEESDKQTQTSENESSESESSSDSAESSGTVSLGRFKLTAYCPCYQCSKGWGRMTSSGKIAQPHHTIATDPSVIPEGTVVMINGERYVAEDIGGGVNGNHIDIFYESHSVALDFGVQYAEVYAVY